MAYIYPCYLCKEVDKENDNGDPVVGLEKRKVLVDEQSIRQSEAYQAQACGLKPEITILVRNFEYGGEKIVIYNDIQYEVLRTFDKKNSEIEIVLYKGINNGISE